MDPVKTIAIVLPVTLLLTAFSADTILAADAARVAGDLRVDGLYFSKDPAKTLITKPSDFPFPWTTLNSDIYYLTGNVGIGTTSPATKLDVDGTVKATQLTGGNLTIDTGSALNGGGSLSGAFDTSGANLNGGTFSNVALNNPVINGGTLGNTATSVRHKGLLPISPSTPAGSGGCTLSSGTGTQVVNCPGTANVCQTYNPATGLSPSRCALIADAACRKYCIDNSSSGQNSVAVSQRFQFTSNGTFSGTLDKSWVCYQNGNIAARINTGISYCPDQNPQFCNAAALASQSPTVPFGSTGFVFTDSAYTIPVTDTALAGQFPQSIQIWLTAGAASTTTGTSSTCWLVQKNQLANQTNPTLELILTPYAPMESW